MAKGSIGTQTNTIIRMKKPNPIPCDCGKCIHRKTRGAIKYCSYYDIFLQIKLIVQDMVDQK